MEKDQYSLLLEHRISKEFLGMATPGLSRLWCDGVILEAYLLDESPPRILGHAWIVEGQEQQEWKLELLLPPSMRSQESIDWAALLPAENVTRWLAVDRASRFV